VQRAKAQSKTGILRGYVVVEARPILQAGWSDCLHFSLSLFVSFAYLEFLFKFLYS
jgi:hypothetical protein